MYNFLSFFNVISNDLAQPWQLGFQDGASPGFTGIVELHNTIFFYLVVISVGVFWLLGSIIYFYNNSKSLIIHKYLNHGTLIELIWTITPALILIAIAFPSFRLLYLLDSLLEYTEFNYFVSTVICIRKYGTRLWGPFPLMSNDKERRKPCTA